MNKSYSEAPPSATSSCGASLPGNDFRRTRILRSLLPVLILAFVLTPSTFAQVPGEVVYQQDFQSFSKNANPPGWVDTSIGSSSPQAEGLYKCDLDPTDGKRSSNIVYGTGQSSGHPEGSNPRIGTFSTLVDHHFDGSGRFEYRGRFVRTRSDSRIGLTFFSSYPEQDRYYLLGLWSRPSGGMSMQLFSFGAGTLSGDLDTDLEPEPESWYRFLVQVDALDDGTHIRIRIWPDGTDEPETFSIEALDDSPDRLTGGRIGLWAAVKGGAYFDELLARSPVDVTAPTIEFREGGQPLPDGKKFNRDVFPQIIVTDDVDPHPAFTALLDGVPFTSETPVTTEQNHTITVHAEDSVHHGSDAQVSFVVDKSRPEVSVTDGDLPLVGDSWLNHDVPLRVHVDDLTATTPVATIDEAPYELTRGVDEAGLPLPYFEGAPVTAEGAHTLTLTVTDAVGWETTIEPITFTIDKTPPALTITSHPDGVVVGTPRQVFTGGASDAVELTVNGQPAIVDLNSHTWTSPELLLEGTNGIAISGQDRAGNRASLTIAVILDSRKPQVLISSPANGICTSADSLQISGGAIDPHLDVVTLTIDGSPLPVSLNASTGLWTASAANPPEGDHRLVATATDTLGHRSTAARIVTVDRTAPVTEITDSGLPSRTEPSSTEASPPSSGPPMPIPL